MRRFSCETRVWQGAPRFIQQAVRSVTGIAAALLAAGALASNAGAAPGDPYDGYNSAIYGDPAHWLCRPDTELGDPADPRTDDTGGDVTPEWGLHLADANLAMGDLVLIAKRQARMWTRLPP